MELFLSMPLYLSFYYAERPKSAARANPPQNQNTFYPLPPDLIVRRFSILILLPHPQGVYPIYLSQPQDRIVIED